MIVIDHGGNTAAGDALAGGALGLREGERTALLARQIRNEDAEILRREDENRRRNEWQAAQLEDQRTRTGAILEEQRLRMDDRARAAEEEQAQRAYLAQSFRSVVQSPEELDLITRQPVEVQQRLLGERQKVQMERAKAQGVMQRAVQMARAGMLGPAPMQGPGTDGQPMQPDPQTVELASRVQSIIDGLEAEPWRHEEFSKALDGVEQEHARVIGEQETRKRNAATAAADIAQLQDNTPGLFGRGMVLVGKYTRGDIDEEDLDEGLSRMKWLARNGSDAIKQRYNGERRWRDRAQDIYDAVDDGMMTAAEGGKALRALDESFDKVQSGIMPETFELAVSDRMLRNPRESRAEAEAYVRSVMGYGPDAKRTATLESPSAGTKPKTKGEIDLDPDVMRARSAVEDARVALTDLERAKEPSGRGAKAEHQKKLAEAKAAYDSAREREIMAVQKARGAEGGAKPRGATPSVQDVKRAVEEFRRKQGRPPSRDELKAELGFGS